MNNYDLIRRCYEDNVDALNGTITNRLTKSELSMLRSMMYPTKPPGPKSEKELTLVIAIAFANNHVIVLSQATKFNHDFIRLLGLYDNCKGNETKREGVLHQLAEALKELSLNELDETLAKTNRHFRLTSEDAEYVKQEVTRLIETAPKWTRKDFQN